MTAKKRVGVLISGRGSNLQALIDAAKAQEYPAELALVISNVPGVQGLARAEIAGALGALVDGAGELRLADEELVLRDSLTFRGMERLAIVLS